MERKRYLYRRERDGKILRLGREWVWKQDVAGFITLPNGDVARRCWGLEEKEGKDGKGAKKVLPRRLGEITIYSDALGFPIHQLGEMEEHLRNSGVRGVEFRRDPTEPLFVQAVCDGFRAYERYAKARGMLT